MIEFKESHIIDGTIAVNVNLDDENIGTAYVSLAQWDRLREVTKHTNSISTLNLVEQERQESE